jgi:plasmid stabilization system protein ParE
MSYTVRFTPEAKEDVVRLYSFLLETDIDSAEKALEALTKSVSFLQDFPFSCRKVFPENPFLRELLVPFGSSGYVVLFEIQEEWMVTVLAIRHQREGDYY